MALSPRFEVLADGEPLVASGVAVDLRTDGAGGVRVTLPTAGEVVPPPPRASLRVSVGWDGLPLREFGPYVRAGLEDRWGDQAVALRGESVLYRGAFAARRTRSWAEPGLTFGAAMRRLAEPHGYTVVMPPTLAASIVVPEDLLIQIAESDRGVLERIVRARNADVHVLGARVVIVLASAATTVTGRPLAFTADPEEAHDAVVSVLDRARVAAVQARWYSWSTASHHTVRVGDAGDPTPDTLPGVYPVEALARRAAEHALDDRRAQSERLTLTLRGRPDIIPESVLTLGSWRPPYRGAWRPQAVLHNVDGTGFRTTIVATR